ncbi:MAG: DUF559 domain-containing protein [Actinobacteria bacterium]|nr:DUF559 domain-containing protein [Actinomycetota bacterium]
MARIDVHSADEPSRRSSVWGLARVQHGVVTRAQLVECGLSGEAIEHRIRTRRLHRVHHCVYAVGRPQLTREGRWLAAVLACGPGAVLSHLSAALCWGIVGGANLRRGGPVHVTVPAGRRPRPSGVRVHRRAALDASERSARDRIPLTSPIRTMLDLAAELPAPRLERAVGVADKLGLASPDQLRLALAERRGARGVGALRALLDRESFAVTDSELERRFLPIARRAGLPLPETQAMVCGFRVDFHWPCLGLVVETDGLRYHRTASQQARDRARDQAMTEAGLVPLRFTHGQVLRQPARVEHTLRKVARRLRS